MSTRIRTTIVAAVVAGFWLCLGGTPAGAHTQLVSSSPEAGVTLGAAPTSVRVSFSEDLGAGSTMAVTGPSGQELGDGPARVQGPDVRIAIAAGSPDGTWTTAYRVISYDGHPVTGQFTFTVEAAPSKSTPLDTPSVTVAPSTPAPAAAAPAPDDGRPDIWAITLAVAVVAALGLAIALVVRRRRAR
jgi:copper resistance protein C